MAIRVREKDFPWVLLWGFAIVTILLLVLLLPLEFNEKNNVEVAYSSDSEKSDKVYIDITYCEPKYVISDSLHPARGAEYIVCEAKSVSNGTLLVAISEYYYRSDNFEGGKVVDSYKYYESGSYVPIEYPTLSFDSPYRFHCRVSDAEEYGLSDKESEGIVLELNYNNES